MAKKQRTGEVECTITPPNLQVGVFVIEGTSWLAMNAFSQKAKEQMVAAQEAGTAGKNTRRKKEAKDFNACYEASMHRSAEGWYGIPASGIRAAMVSACRVAGFAMTRAKLAVFVLPDGYDALDKTPLVKITKGTPERQDHAVTLKGGTRDIHSRAFWAPGWQAEPKIQFDADQFRLQDVANLLMRVGMQVGVLEGRHDSKTSTGMGWGTFQIVNQQEQQ